MRKKIKQDIVDKVSREIHQYIALPTLAMYYDMLKLVKDDTSAEEREAASTAVNNMMITAESLYDDLNDKQKELLEDLARSLINLVIS